MIGENCGGVSESREGRLTGRNTGLAHQMMIHSSYEAQKTGLQAEKGRGSWRSCDLKIVFKEGKDHGIIVPESYRQNEAPHKRVRDLPSHR